MSELLPCVEVLPRGKPTSSVVWLHGLGASGHDFEPVVPHLRLPNTRFVFPHAPQRPVTINMGLVMPAWYDIAALDRTGAETERHVRESDGLVRALLEREKERGVPPARTVLAGFSQGAALALFTGVRYPETLAGLVALSGYELLGGTRAAEASAANQATPIFFGHGRYDPMVPLALGRAAHAAYAMAGRDAQWHEYPIEHSVSMPEIDEIGAWLRERLADPA
jgi:phospholipase/carboxylesterase